MYKKLDEAYANLQDAIKGITRQYPKLIDRIPDIVKKDSGVGPDLARLKNSNDATAVVNNVMSKLAEGDPTEPKFSYLDTILRWYVNGEGANPNLDDMPSVKENLQLFMRYSNAPDSAEFPKSQRNLQMYPTFAKFKDLMDPLKQKSTAKQQQSTSERDYVKNNSEVILGTPGSDFYVLSPKTTEASQILGANTVWCTAYTKSPCRFDEYNQSGKLYIIFAKIGGRNRRYQVHMEREEFADEKNNTINKQQIAELSRFPQYKEFLNMLIEKYYGPYFKAAEQRNSKTPVSKPGA